MADTDKDDIFLDAYFAAARAEAPEASAGLLARIAADADAVSAARSGAEAAPVARAGLLATLLAAIGGWPAVAGLATATVAGVWIGFAQPAGVDSLASDFLSVDSDGYLVDLSPGFDTLLSEG